MSNSRPRTAALALIACGAVATARAQEAQEQDVASRSQAEIALSNDTAQLRYLTPGEKVGVDRSRASATFFLSEERDIVLSADLMFPADIGGRAFEIRFGPRPYAALLDEENDDVLALSVGTEMRLTLDSRTGLAIAGHAFYSPDILTFGSADNLVDLGARLEVRLQPRLTVFGGMRWFEFDLTDGQGERTLQEEVFAGLGWRF